jgi:hypothetical protein
MSASAHMSEVAISTWTLEFVRWFPEERWMFMENYDCSDADFVCGDFRRGVWGKKVRVFFMIGIFC